MSMSVDFDLDFDDRTIIESGGDFTEIVRIMKEDSPSDTWMLRSGLHMVVVIHGQMMEAQFLLHFYSDGKIRIMEYRASSNDPAYNPDISGLSEWIKSKGWSSVKCGYDIPPTDDCKLPLIADNKQKDIEFVRMFKERITKRFLENKNGN